MELKNTKKLPTSVDVGVTPASGRNDPNNKQRVYDIIFPTKEDEGNPNTEIKDTHKGYDKLTFGGVSTLDWLKTWRSLEES
tara:strand:+ start:1464 stop:1706 length:243 start_codon:yes stop_codon:yes gene_type:complete